MVTAFLGPNGAGKTTTMYVVTLYVLVTTYNNATHKNKIKNQIVH